MLKTYAESVCEFHSKLNKERRYKTRIFSSKRIVVSHSNMDKRSDSASSGRASGSSEEPRDTITTGWSDECACYRCRDGVTLEAPKAAAIRYARDRKSDTLKARLSI